MGFDPRHIAACPKLRCAARGGRRKYRLGHAAIAGDLTLTSGTAKHIRTRLPGSGSAQILPPCASMIERQMDIPSPAPRLS
jgi:hypothetical protein